MRDIHLNTSGEDTCTLLPDIFIEHHMPHANGEFVKVYIYLLQLVQRRRSQFSLPDAADTFACTESDILRAIRFWESRGLIEVSRAEDEETIAGIRFVPAEQMREMKSSSSAAPQQHAKHLPEGSRHRQGSQTPEMLTNDRTRQLLEEEAEVRQIVMVAEEYLGRTLSSTDLNRLLYLYDELHLSVDLIDYLIEYCVLKEKRSMHYIEKVGLEWYNDGVKTVAEAKERTISWSRDYYRILRAFGISNRNPLTREVRYMKKWLNEYALSMDLIREACERTVTQTGRAQFDYADKILTSWKDAGVKSPEDIAALDRQHSAAKESVKITDSSSGNAGSSTSGVQKRRATSGSRNQFNNFTQRSYDFDALEQQLLQKQKHRSETAVIKES